MKDPKYNNGSRQPEEGINNDLHLTNQDVSLINSSGGSQPGDSQAEERTDDDENSRQSQIDRKASPEFDSDSLYANL